MRESRRTTSRGRSRTLSRRERIAWAGRCGRSRWARGYLPDPSGSRCPVPLGWEIRIFAPTLEMARTRRAGWTLYLVRAGNEKYSSGSADSTSAWNAARTSNSAAGCGAPEEKSCCRRRCRSTTIHERRWAVSGAGIGRTECGRFSPSRTYRVIAVRWRHLAPLALVLGLGLSAAAGAWTGIRGLGWSVAALYAAANLAASAQAA